jgi:nickel-dependent lactate racemase
MELYLTAQNGLGLSEKQIIEALKKSIEGRQLKKVLLIPPDFTRFYSNAGLITQTYYHLLEGSCRVDVMPALGTHEPMSKEQCHEMFGDLLYEQIIHHNWRKDVIKIGEVPSNYIKRITEDLWSEPVPVEVNHRIMDTSYDLIISIGQVVPHEVIGMANHSKNIFVGCGGTNIINSSHMIGAVYGMERMMGKDFTPVRKVLDYAAEHFLSKRPILYVLTVTTTHHEDIITHGLFIGEKRKALEEAIALSQKKNIDFLDRGIQKCIVYLEPKEFRSTWLGNKAIYRTRMAIKDGGELIVLAPGVTKFGEDSFVDKLIRKYGYRGRTRVLELFKENDDLKKNMGAAAHLIHGSSDGRFQITYAVKNITKEEVESVLFHAIDYDEIIKKYDPHKLKYGWNILDDGEEIFFIPNPALGLWIDKTRF